ncbi:putative membrane protein [Flavobacterium daejeonense]|nr:putative membrane protein [Flavobacterium daejeonense]
MNLLFYYFWIINILGFVQNAFDKRQAIKGKRRIPERRLLGIVFFGGTVGSGLAMLIFSHKTAKTSYILQFFGIVVLQILITYYFYNQ